MTTLLFVLVGAPWSVFAADLPGSTDHPVVSRFKGAEITEYLVSDFDQAVMPAQVFGSHEDRAAGAVLVAEGRITRIGYLVKGSKSPLEISRSYLQALTAAGFKVLFGCEARQCGLNFESCMGRRVIPDGKFDLSSSERNRYLLARCSAADGEIYAMIYAMERSDTTLIYQQIVEVKPLNSGQVKVLDAATLRKSLEADGHVALYGLHFDTGRVDIKPDSKATLEQMAALLKNNPALKVYIVGHTDNVGTLAANLELSPRRADAVSAALRNNYGIDAWRLVAKGLASFAPVASNAAEPGRAQNRRVELVAQ